MERVKQRLKSEGLSLESPDKVGDLAIAWVVHNGRLEVDLHRDLKAGGDHKKLMMNFDAIFFQFQTPLKPSWS